MEDGADKYGLTNWREHQVSASVYYNAAFRHLAAWWDGEENAVDSGVHHLGHVMACCAIILDAQYTNQLNDDRPEIPGPFSATIRDLIGHGMNLQYGGHHIVWFGLNSSLELYQQLNARLPRPGQTADRVFIHHILTEGTFDTELVGVLSDRDAIQDRITEAVKMHLGL